MKDTWQVIRREAEHAWVRDRKIAGRNGHIKPPYAVSLAQRAVDFQGSSFQPQGWQKDLYRRAQLALIRNKQGKNNKLIKLADKLARRDEERRVFWEELADKTTSRTLSVGLGVLSKDQLIPSDKNKIGIDDPFFERFFENNGQLLIAVSQRLTGITQDSLSIHFAGRNENKMHPLQDMKEFKQRALRYRDVNEMLAIQYRRRRKDDSKERAKVPFAQVVDTNGSVVLGMEFAPTQRYYQFRGITNEDGEVIAGIKLSGDLIINWIGGKQLRGPAKEAFIKTIFADKVIKGSEKQNGKVLPPEGDIYVRVPLRSGHHVEYPHQNGAQPKRKVAYHPMAKYIGRVASAFFRP